MTWLLDTHVLLWALGEPDRLSRAARRVLRDPDSQLVVSAASAWEISTKQRLGKLPGAEVLTGQFARHLRHLGARAADITAEHALLAGQLDWDHRDPFDRMLAAQSLTESWTLITQDRAFASLPGVRTHW